MYTKFRAILISLLLLTTQMSAFAAECEFDCKGKCTTFGITNPICYNNCLGLEQACRRALLVIPPIVKVVAQNLEWAFVLAPINTLSLLTINYAIQGADDSKVTYPIDIPKAPAPSTGVVRDITVDCLYRTAPAGTTMFIAVSATKPDWFDPLNRGDEARATGSNANCAARDGSTLIPKASIRIDAKFASDEYTLFGRPADGINAAVLSTQKIGKPAITVPQTTTFYGILTESGANYSLKFIDPTADRSIEVPKAVAKTEQTKVQVTLPGSAALTSITKVTLPASAIVTLRQSGAAASTLASLARLQPLLDNSSQQGPNQRQPSILSFSTYPGDLACVAAKSTLIYWQAYGLVKLAKDNGLIKNDKQCNDANYTATVVAAMIGGGEPIIQLLTGVYGGCICFDLF